MDDNPTHDTADGEKIDPTANLHGESQIHQTMLSVYDILSSPDSLSEHDRSRITERLTQPTPLTESAFLKKLPLEVRNRIYHYLLYSPEFSDPGFRGYFSGVSTNILRTCKTIHDEAYPVLYHQNTFFIRFGFYDEEPSWFQGIFEAGFNKRQFNKTMDLCQRIKRLRVVVNDGLTTNFWEDDTQQSFRIFCHRIFHCGLHSLEILTFRGLHVEDLRSLLEPVRNLRNVRKFSLRYAIDGAQYNFDTARYIDEVDSEFEEEIRQLVTGRTPVDDIQEMHNSLVDYVVAFEPRYLVQENMIQYYYYHPYDGPYMENEYPLSCSREFFDSGCHPQTTYLALFDMYHPIGEAIYASKESLRNGGSAKFRETRHGILQFLESQYQRIIKTSIAVAEHVKIMKRMMAHLQNHPMSSEQKYVYAEGLIYLEDFEEALDRGNRSMEFSISCKLSGGTAHLDSVQSSGVKELASQLRNGNFHEFSEEFQSTVDELNTRYLDIRKARRKLYEGDAVKPISGIRIGEFPPLSDEMVVWDADEPILGPWKGARMYDTCNFGDGLRWEGTRFRGY